MSGIGLIAWEKRYKGISNVIKYAKEYGLREVIVQDIRLFNKRLDDFMNKIYGSLVFDEKINNTELERGRW